jgi:hypothetical protein
MGYWKAQNLRNIGKIFFLEFFLIAQNKDCFGLAFG